MKPTLSPYLNFNGNAAEAMKFYESVLGGKLTIQTFGESGMPTEEQFKDQVVHAHLATDTMNIMASDSGHMGNVQFGNNVHLSLNGSDEALLTGWFEKLSEGGKVDMPLAKQFWGDTFGMLTDRFGVHWMVNIASATNEQ
jgi:PhnB protein